MTTDNQIPRRARFDLLAPAEKSILSAMQAVEQLPASDTLTNAIVSLDKAKNLVADFIDENTRFIGTEPKKDLTFGQALEALKQRKAVGRKGWNGKNMYLFISTGNYAIDAPATHNIDGIRSDLFEFGGEGTSTRLPHIVMRTATGSFVPWVTSQADVFAEDWCIEDHV